MTHKEFYIWLDGFLTNRCWTVIQQKDIESIKDKMKGVKGELDFDIDKYKGHKSSNPFNAINPIIDGVNDDFGHPPKIVM